jgi:hypothetical protein
MPLQLSISFDVHQKESNPISQAFLDAHRDDFAMDAWKILLELLKGEKLTNEDIRNRRISLSPTRRFTDISEWGVNISKEAITVPYSKRPVQSYWLEPDEILRVYRRIAEGMKIEKRKKAA